MLLLVWIGLALLFYSSWIVVGTHGLTVAPSSADNIPWPSSPSATTTSHSPPNIIIDADVGIVGAGPAGLVLAQALRQRGYSVKIWERRPSLLTRPVGAAVFLHPFALRSLRSVFPTLEEQLLQACTPIRSIHMLSTNKVTDNEGGDNNNNNRLFGTDQLDQAPSIMGAPFVTVKFWDMLCALREGLSEDDDDDTSFELGCTVTGFVECECDDKGDNVVRVDYEDMHGETRSTNVSVLFDCGGIRSTIRNQLIGDEAIPRLRVTYAVAKMENLWSSASDKQNDDDDERVLAFVMGDGKSVTTANLPNGDIWWTQTQYDDDPRARLFSQNSHDINTATGINDDNDLRAQLDARFADWPSNIRRLVQATPVEDIIESTLSEFQPVFRWGKGRVTLVGDAAHAQLPALGLGVSTAFADVAELCRQIDRHGLPCGANTTKNSKGNAALRWYEAVRIPQTAVLQIASRMAYFVNLYIGRKKQ